jgi:hypothetical protein
VTDY